MQISRAHDAEISPAASASPTAGWAASRRAQPTAPAAAPLVMRVCHLSHARAEPCPSSSQPPQDMNAANTPARAAVCSDPARSNPRRHSACAAAGSDAISALARYASPAWAIATACAALTGTAPAAAGAVPAAAAAIPAGGAAGTAAGPGWLAGRAHRGRHLLIRIYVHTLISGSDKTAGIRHQNPDTCSVAGAASRLRELADATATTEAADGTEAIRLARQPRPDVCLVDIRMPRQDGIEVTAALAGPGVPDPLRVVIVTTFGLDEYVYGALHAGLSASCSKMPAPPCSSRPSGPPTGDVLISPQVTLRLLRHLAPVKAPVVAQPVVPLSERGIEVIRAIAKGRTNAEIAAWAWESRLIQH